MAWIAGVDISTFFVDVVLVDENGEQPPVWHRTTLTGGDALARTRSLRGRRLLGEHGWDDLLAAGVEDPAGKHGVRAVARVQGALLAHIPHGLLVELWPPSRWRVANGLPGNASKQDVAAWAMRQHPPIRWQTPIPYDATDAYAIACATRQAIEREQAA